jgi:hypothetical protein
MIPRRWINTWAVVAIAIAASALLVAADDETTSTVTSADAPATTDVPPEATLTHTFVLGGGPGAGSGSSSSSSASHAAPSDDSPSSSIDASGPAPTDTSTAGGGNDNAGTHVINLFIEPHVVAEDAPDPGPRVVEVPGLNGGQSRTVQAVVKGKGYAVSRSLLDRYLPLCLPCRGARRANCAVYIHCGRRGPDGGRALYTEAARWRGGRRGHGACRRERGSVDGVSGPGGGRE